MSSKKSPNSSPSFGRSDVPEPKLVGSSKSKPLSDMNRVEVENYIVGLERVVDIYKGTDRTVAKGNLDKVRQYYLDRFEEEDEELTSAPSGESSDDVFVDLEDIDFELDAGGDIFGNSTLSTSPSAPENTLDYDEIVDYKGESKRIRDLDEDVIYTLEDLEKNRAEMEEDQYDFLRQLIMSGQMLTQKPDEQDPLKMQAKMDAARQQDEKNKKEHCLSFFMRPDEDPRSLKRKITAFQEILTEGEVGDIGPFDLLKKEGKIWIVFKNEGMGIELEESHVVLWIKLMNSVGSMGALRTVEEVRSAGGESILSKIKNLPKTKSDEILVKGSASEVSRHITQEIETSGDLVLQKEIKAMDDYQDRLDETKEAVEKGGFQIPHLDAFVDLGGKIGEEDRFGMRPVEYEGKFNFIDRNNMSVYASNFDDWFDEIGAFKLQTLNTGLNLKSVTALVKHQGEFKFLESDGTLYKLDEQKILIEDASVFDEVGLEDQYGLRCVKWNGLYNFVDSKNRILSSEKWFSEVSPFRSVAIPRLAESESKMPISLVKVDGEMHFFIPSGRLHTPSFDELKEYFKSEGAEEGAWSKIEFINPETEPPQMIYLDSFSRRLRARSERHQDDLERANAFAKLADDIDSLEGHQDARLDWGIALLIIKEKLQDSTLPAYDKRHFLFELNSVAMAANVQSEEFSPSEIDRYKWQECGTFDGGMVVNVETEEGTQSTLTDFDGNLLYPEGQFFEYIGPFTGNLAVVRKKGKYNFINRADGKLLVDGRWFDEAHEFHAGLSRVRTGNRWNFIHCNNGLISERGYENAKDFNNKTGQAEVYINGMWISIDQNGASMMSVMTRMFASFRRRKKTGDIPSVLNLREEGGEDILRAPLPLNRRIHVVFSELLKEFPKNAFKITQLFGYFKADIDGAIKTGEKVNIITLNGILMSRISQFKLPEALKKRLRSFVARMDNEDFNGKEMPKLPVDFLSIFKEVLNSCSHQEEGRLLRLLRRMELRISRVSCLDKKEVFKVSMEMEQLIKNSKLEDKTKRKVKHLMWSVMNNEGVYFKGGGSIVKHRPKTLAAKGSQRVIRKAIKRDLSRLVGNPVTYFRNVCELAEAGRWSEAQWRYEKLMEARPDYKFKQIKLATLLNECFNKKRMEMEALSQWESELLKGELVEIRKFMLQVYSAAQKRQPKNADICFNLGLIKEDMASAKDNWLRKLFVVQPEQKEAKELLVRASQLRSGSEEIQEKRKSISRMIFGRRFRLAVLVTLGLSAAAVTNYKPANDLYQKWEQSQYNPFRTGDSNGKKSNK